MEDTHTPDFQFERISSSSLYANTTPGEERESWRALREAWMLASCLLDDGDEDASDGSKSSKSSNSEAVSCDGDGDWVLTLTLIDD